MSCRCVVDDLVDGSALIESSVDFFETLGFEPTIGDRLIGVVCDQLIDTVCDRLVDTV